MENKLICKEKFLDKYNILIEDFDGCNLKWEELELIYNDYLVEIPKLENAAVYIFNNLMKTKGVHSVRYRVKNEEHVIEKIIRKRIGDVNRIIDVSNYKYELTDLIGVRALHLFKHDMSLIDNFIRSTWDFKERPTIYYRKGDQEVNDEEIQLLENSSLEVGNNEILVDKNNIHEGFDNKVHIYGYRSVHYVIKTKPAKIEYFAEIQIRTIFEEAYSEIDHTIRYPYDIDNEIYLNYLLILNRLAGTADEMGTYVFQLKNRMYEMDKLKAELLEERDAVIKELEAKINTLDINQNDSNEINRSLEKIKKASENNNVLINNQYLDNISKISNFKNINFPNLKSIEVLNSMINGPSFESIKTYNTMIDNSNILSLLNHTSGINKDSLENEIDKSKSKTKSSSRKPKDK